MPLEITALARYPIKGCRGHFLDRIQIDRLGVEGDRRLMLVDDGNAFLSQREVPRLATIIPLLEDDVLTVAAPGCDLLVHETDHDGPLRPVELWGNSIWATDQGEVAARWFSEAIGQRCRLVLFGSASERLLDPAFSPRADAETAFADGYPLLATLEESLADLNLRLEAPVPMDRFRPNVIVRGAEAWSEDQWRSLQMGGLVFDAVKPCARCTVPTTDQETGARHPGQEPLRTLATFRTLPGRGTIFGQNLVPRHDGSLRVGELVQCQATTG